MLAFDRKLVILPFRQHSSLMEIESGGEEVSLPPLSLSHWPLTASTASEGSTRKAVLHLRSTGDGNNQCEGLRVLARIL